MTDVIVSRLPKYVDQFAATIFDESPSLFRCGTAAGASAVDFAYPDRYNPYLIEHSEYVKLVGPDVPQDHNGVTDEKMLQFFRDFNVGVIYMKELVDEGLSTGDYSKLHAEIQAQNDQGVIQFMSVVNEEQLMDASTGASLHPGLHYGHCILRLGYSTDAGYGMYYDPAAPHACTDNSDPKNPKTHPVKISWQSLLTARINSCFAIMPHGVPVPPAGFSYQAGVWPAPKPVFDAAKALSTIAAMQQALSTEVQRSDEAHNALNAALANLANDLSVLKAEV